MSRFGKHLVLQQRMYSELWGSSMLRETNVNTWVNLHDTQMCPSNPIEIIHELCGSSSTHLQRLPLFLTGVATVAEGLSCAPRSHHYVAATKLG